MAQRSVLADYPSWTFSNPARQRRMPILSGFVRGQDPSSRSGCLAGRLASKGDDTPGPGGWHAAEWPASGPWPELDHPLESAHNASSAIIHGGLGRVTSGYGTVRASSLHLTLEKGFAWKGIRAMAPKSRVHREQADLDEPRWPILEH